MLFPGLSSSGDQVVGEHSHPQVGVCVLLPPPSQLLGFLGVQWVHLLRFVVCLFWGADLWLRHSRWMSTVQNPKKCWVATTPPCSLVEDASLGLRLPLLGSGSPRQPVSGGGWAGPQLLALLSPLFCEWAWQCLRLGLLAG